MNSSSQTAFDIAKFWGHRHISNLLGRTDDGCRRVLPGSDPTPQENYFSRETLDRLSGKRTDKVWLEAKQSNAETVYLLFSNLSPMVSASQRDDSTVRVQGSCCNSSKRLLMISQRSQIIINKISVQ